MFNLFARKVHISKSYARRASKISANNVPNKRNLRLEQLEDRALLSVSTGEYAEIRDAYPALNLPETADSLNLIEIDAGNLTSKALRDAIADAEKTTSDDLIVVRTTDEANTINITSEVVIDVNSSKYGALNVVALGTQPLTLDANHNSRVLYIENGLAGLANLTITDGRTWCYDYSYYDEFSDEHLIYYEGDLDSFGSGIYVASQGSLTSSNITISENEVQIDANEMFMYHHSCGGGVYVASGGSFTAVNTNISGNGIEGCNQEQCRGGGVCVESKGSFTAINTTISENYAFQEGGGVYVDYEGSFIAINTTISGNSSADYTSYEARDGGGVYVKGSFTATNTTISGNSTTGNGGGVCVVGTFVSNNSIIAANQNGDDIYQSTGTVEGDNNLSTFSSWSGSNNILYDESAPLFRDAEKGDYRLAVNSQAIDKGSNQHAFDAGMDETSTDLEGCPRFVGASIDIGACEYQSTVVDTLNDSFDLYDGEWSLREAIYYAPENVTITFAENLSGTIKLAFGELKIDKALAIDGDKRITIDAGQKSRVMSVEAGTTENPVVLNGLTIQNGKNSESEKGDGIYLSGVLNAVNTTISGNSSTNRYGGGVYVGSNSSFTATDTTISGNSAWFGGGVYVYEQGSFTATNTTIVENSAVHGGGVYVDGSFTATNTTISGNSTSDGGGVYVYEQGSFTATNTTISRNSSVFHGGGVSIYGSFTATNTVIAGNSAGDYGGGIFAPRGDVTVINTTIAGNSAKYYGGGVSSGRFTAINTIISANYTFSDNFEYNTDVDGTLSPESSNNLINYYPMFVCGPVFNNGSLINADALDLRLRSDSPAINVGSNTAVEEITTDLDGNVRVYNGRVDIGAYEYQGDRSDKSLYSTVVDTLNDSFDPNDGEWSLREAIYYAPRYVTITFAENLNGTIILTHDELKIDRSLAIDGDKRITIDAGQNSRVISVTTGTEENPVILSNLTIQNGKTFGWGGGIYLRGVLNAINTTIAGNSAEYGGGVYVYDNGSFTATNTTIARNSAEEEGGGVYVDSNSSFTATNATIARNSAEYCGGVYIYFRYTSYTDYVCGYFVSNNSIVAENISDEYLSDDPFSSYEDIYVELRGGNTDNAGYDDIIIAFIVKGENNLSTYWIGGNHVTYYEGDPLFRDAENGDYRLVADSEAIDAGSNQCAFDAGMDKTSTDLEGSPRCVGSSIDIGAYEYQGYSFEDNYEENDALETAYDLGTISSTQTYKKLVAGRFSDQDWYKFTLAQGEKLDLAVSLAYAQTTNRRTVDLYLYDASGVELAKSTSGTGAERISLSDLAVGAYYIKAYNANDVAVDVPYELTITTVDLAFYRPKGWSDSVIFLTGSKATSSKTTYSAGQNVYLRFAFNGNETLNGTFKQEVYLDGVLRKSFTTNGSKTNVVSGVNYTYSLGKLAVGEHTITVKLDAKNNVAETNESNNERTFTITVLPDDKYESNDTLTKAADLGTITSLQTYTGLIAGANRNLDWYKFTLASKGVGDSYVEATYTHVKGRDDVNLYLYDARGRQIASSSGTTGTERISLKGRAAGTYYVLAYNNRSVSSNVDYSLTFKPVPTFIPTVCKSSAILSNGASITSSKTTEEKNQDVDVKFASSSNETINETTTDVVSEVGYALATTSRKASGSAVLDAKLFRSAFEDASCTPFEEEDDFGFVEEFFKS